MTIKKFLTDLATVAVAAGSAEGVVVPLLHLSAGTATEVAGVTTALAALVSALKQVLGPKAKAALIRSKTT